MTAPRYTLQNTANQLGYTRRKILKEVQALQELPGFTIDGASKAIGNGVPLPL